MVLTIILLAIAALIAVILIRTAMFKPKNNVSVNEDEIELDGEAAINALAELIKCRTVSHYTKSKEDDGEFEKLIAKLPELYPNVIKTCSMLTMEDRAILFRWKGKENGNPAVLMAHYDVVPADEKLWSVPAFDGIIKDGALWGRGAIDTKGTFNGILSGAENLIKQGFVPKNDIYFAFSGGEEVNGPGAIHIVDYFEEKGIVPELVIDEGGAVVEDVFPGVKQPCGLIGIAEKGLLNLRYNINSDGGHASAPAPHTPVGRLAMACTKVEAHPFKAHFTKPVLEMFDTLGRHSTFLYRMIFSNLWCFRGVLDMICKKSGGELNALVRTTVAFTQMKGSDATNVIPPSASMVSNLRINPEDSVDGAIEYIRGVINDPDITLEKMENMSPSPISRTDVKGWDIVAGAVAGTWKGALVAPYLMVQCSDSRHYGRISDRVYRFSAVDLTAEERHSIHGNDEHVRLETVKRTVEFFMRVMKRC